MDRAITLKNNILTSILLVWSFSFLYTQTIIEGTVYDRKTGEALPFVNIAFQGTNTGHSTNLNGFYRIETTQPTDTLEATFVGYKTEKKAITQGKFQKIDFQLHQEAVDLDVVQIVASAKYIDPAKVLFKNIQKHKKENNREKYEAYDYEVYNKVSFSLNNVDESLFENKVMKQFDFMKDYLDSSNEKVALPVFITESVSEIYYRKNPKAKKEFIKATKISGVQNQSAAQFLGDMYQNFNIYDNHLQVFNLFFLSPLADAGLFSYNYKLTDSAMVENKWCYRLEFDPKRKQENTFEGFMWVHDSTYAIVEIDAQMSPGTNINWVNTFKIHQKFKEIQPGDWMLEEDELLVDFEALKSTMGMYGHRKASYQNIRVNDPQSTAFYEGANNIIVAENTFKNNEQYWDSIRHSDLAEKDKSIYEMVDSVQNVPAYRTIADIIQLFVLGYKVIGPVEIGPYYTLYSFNAIEGNRFRIGGRTSNQFSTNLMIDGYLAYGSKDKRFKYGIGAMGFITKHPRQIVSLYYKNDVEQLGQGLNSWRQDNILSSVFRRNPANRLNGFEEIKLSYQYEWFYGLSNTLGITQRSIWPLGQLNFSKSGVDSEPVQVSQINTFEITVETRFANKEKYLSGEFERISLGTKWPVFNLLYGYGVKGFFDGEYEYHKVKVQMQDFIDIPPLGYSDLVITAGKYFGTLPYPLLELHNGNETYSYDNTAFNLMNFYEFVSDEYASVSLTHHFNGLIFNKIPLLRKLKFREVAQIRAVYGRLSEQSKNQLIFPPTLSSLSQKPYVEAGVGIENILKVFRLDLIKRFTYVSQDYIQTYESNLNATKISTWGLRGGIQIMF